MLVAVLEGEGAVVDAPVRVGVTGHRTIGDVVVVSGRVDEVLLDIAGDEPGRRLLAVSALAEGADRLVAERVLARGGGVEVILPLPADDYEQDFADAGSRAEFRRLLAVATDVRIASFAGPTRDDAYLAAGRGVVERCDVLLALWDGEASRGRGGTAEIVGMARATGHPVRVVPITRAGTAAADS